MNLRNPRNLRIGTFCRRINSVFGFSVTRRRSWPHDVITLIGRRWKRHRIDSYGELIERDWFTFTTLWYQVCSNRPVRIVVAPDLKGRRDGQFLFTTDLEMTPQTFIFCSTGRLAIEVAFCEAKQHLRMDHPKREKTSRP